MNEKQWRNLFIIGFSMCLLITIFAVIHSYEARAIIRCDGESVFPHSEEDFIDGTVREGLIKMDNALLHNLIGKNVEIHEPIRIGNSIYIKTHKDCYYSRISDWRFR